MPKRSTEAKNLDDDEWKIYENLTQQNKEAEEHNQQQARRAQRTAGEKSIPNSRGESNEQKEQC